MSLTDWPAQASVDALFSILTGTLVAAAIIPGLPLLVLFAIVHTEIYQKYS